MKRMRLMMSSKNSSTLSPHCTHSRSRANKYVVSYPFYSLHDSMVSSLCDNSLHFVDTESFYSL